MEAQKKRGRWIAAILVLALLAFGGWWLFGNDKARDAQAAKKGPASFTVVTARAESRDVPVRVRSNGTVTALQSVDIRAQVTSTVREVHIREGQNVKQGELLFTLDARTEEANLRKAMAQVEKDRADLATAERNLARQRELFQQKFVSQAALDAVQNQVDTLKGQMAIDMAAVEGTRVAKAFMEIRAPFAGRTGAISVRAGSLVQPGATATPLVTIAQIDPITVSFTVPEAELASLQAALSQGPVGVKATPQAGGESFEGKVVFVDNAIETATGTIRVKAEFPNREVKLWPGMYVNVDIATRVLRNATVVPAQAVQTGPDSRFVYAVGEDRKVSQAPVKLAYVEQGFAVVDGLQGGVRVVTEGAQNLRPGAQVTEADRSGTAAPGEPGKAGKGKGQGKGGGNGKGGDKKVPEA
jgi:RND family efflux transporter MFP subunit